MLHVHHARRADRLLTGLADVLRDVPDDPFAPEVVAVHSRGIERWVAQTLALHLGATTAGGDGICANVHFPVPGRIVGDAVARATGVDPDQDAWRADRSVWHLLDVVVAEVAAGRVEGLGPLAIHVVDRAGAPSDRRLGAVRRVADLFDRYAVHRPEMLRAWREGDDLDAGGRLLPDRLAWQPRLWRALRDHLDTPGPAERLARAGRALRDGALPDGQPLALDLPQRLSLFGLTSLPSSYLEVLAALAAGPGPTGATRDVHLFLLHPSPGLWSRVAAATGNGDTPAHGGWRRRRDDDPTSGLAQHPLLAAWGRDAREMQVAVAAAGPVELHDRDDAPAPAASLLDRLQRAIARDEPVQEPGAAESRPLLAHDDRSVEFHRCHGRTRQIEVLHDVLLHALADDPTLEPRDIVAMCPDIETYAPLIEAVFGARRTGSDTGVDLRVQLADRSLRRTNAVLRVVAELLELADAKVTASAVLDLCTRTPVRRRFDLDEDALARIERWLGDAGVRWGLDEAHRARYGVPTDANTWRAGLDRLLVGVAVADERLRTVGGVVPVDDVEGSAVDLAGRLAELVDRLDTSVQQFTRRHTLAGWRDVITDAADALCDVAADDRWQRVQLGHVLDELVTAAHTDHPDGAVPLSLAEIRVLLEDRLRGGPSRAAHRTGDLTVCTLVPMRSIPHPVVVLLGMDDEVFPRRTVPDGDDLLQKVPCVGDRDGRTEDRQLLLDALMAAERRLLVLSTGRDERTNDPRPPAVPIGELRDAIDRTVRLADHRGAADHLTVDHPLQPFDPRRFQPGAIRPDVPFGFDATALQAARALTGQRRDPAAFLSAPLPAATEDVVDLQALAAFLLHPCQELLRQRLGVWYPRGSERPGDAMPTELGGLDMWGVGDRLLEVVIEGGNLDRAIAVERGRGVLPPGRLADDKLAETVQTVEQLLALATKLDVHLDRAGRAVPVDVDLGDGRRLVGAVDGVVGDARRRVQFARLGHKHRLTAWVELLALVATAPDVAWRAVTLGRSRAGSKPDVSASCSVLTVRPTRQLGKGAKARAVPCPLGGVDAAPATRQARARELLQALVDLRDRGLREPLVLPCGTAASFAETGWDNTLGRNRRNPSVQARNAWADNGGHGGPPGESVDHANRLVLGPLAVDELFATPADDSDGPEPEHADGLDPSRLGRRARRLWWPLLAAEEVTDA